MKFARPVLIGTILAVAFFVYTSHRFGTNPGQWVSRAPIQVTEAAGPVPLDAEEQTNIEVYKKVSPAVVNITSRTVAYDFFWGPVPQEGMGSGFIIDKDGHILTNFHVISSGGRVAPQVEVTLTNKKKYKAQIVGTDPSHDLAVLQITAPNLKWVTLGDSSGLQVGQKVYAIGNPFGLNGTMTRGIVSSIRSVREPDEQGGAFIDEAIQTDAAINPGNSGGPLLNTRGEVIGINTMIATGGVGQSAGIGFAIPVNAAKAVLNDLVQYGRVRRPSLGIYPLPIGPELAQELGLPADYGVLIMQVARGGAADVAGLRGGNERAYLGNTPIYIGGDLIVAINGEPVQDTSDLAHVMNNHKAGDAINVTIWRGKRKMQVRVILQEAQGRRT